MPIVGWLARQVARQEHDQKRDQIRGNLQRRVASSARQRLDRELEQRLTRAESRFQDQVIAPLKSLELDPTSVDMHTTRDRITLRSRLSNDRQLAAYSPRPRALKGSLMSAQVHQSTINNLIDQLHVGGKLRPVEEIMQDIATKLGKHRKLVMTTPTTY